MRVSRLLAAALLTGALWTSSFADSRAIYVSVAPACPTAVPSLQKQALLTPFLTGIVTSLLNSAVDAAGAYFTSAATSKSVSMQGSADGFFYKLGASGDFAAVGSTGCLVLVVPGSGDIKPWFQAAKTRAAAMKFPALQLYDHLPQIYAEISFENLSADANTLVLKQQFLHVSSFQEDGWSYRSDRTYSIAVNLRNREDGKIVGSATFTQSNVQPGTRGASKLIAYDAKSAEVLDPSIDASINPAASAQQIPFPPTGAAGDAAATEQKAVAAPFKMAANLVNSSSGAAPVQNVPEWTIQTPPATGDSAEATFRNKLNAFCKSIDALKNAKIDVSADPRCPVEHLQASNDLDNAKAALAEKLNKEWANRFVAFEEKQGRCAKPADKYTCTPPLPAKVDFGPISWEVTVVETRDPNEFAKALASAFSSNKDALKSELASQLPANKQQAEAQAALAAQNAAVAFLLAKNQVDQAQAKLDEAVAQPKSAQLALQADLIRAKAAANAAAAAAGQATPPYPL